MTDKVKGSASQPDLAETKIRKIASNICYEHFGCDEPECLQRKANDEAVRRLKGLLVDAKIEELEMWNAYGHPNIHQTNDLMNRISALQQTRQEEVRE